MITLEHIYWLSGLMMAGVAIVNARDASNRRRFNNTASEPASAPRAAAALALFW